MWWTSVYSASPSCQYSSRQWLGYSGELAQTQGLLPEGSLDKIALLVWVWCFGEMEVEQKEDCNYRDGSKVALRDRQQLPGPF